MFKVKRGCNRVGKVGSRLGFQGRNPNIFPQMYEIRVYAAVNRMNIVSTTAALKRKFVLRETRDQKPRHSGARCVVVFTVMTNNQNTDTHQQLYLKSQHTKFKVFKLWFTPITSWRQVIVRQRKRYRNHSTVNVCQ